MSVCVHKSREKNFHFLFFSVLVLVGTTYFLGTMLKAESAQSPVSNSRTGLEQELSHYFEFKIGPEDLFRVRYSLIDLGGTFHLGFNENDEFSPGSLLKLAVVMGFLKESEVNPALLSQRIYFNDRSLLKPRNSISCAQFKTSSWPVLLCPRAH